MPATGELIDNLRNAIEALCQADPQQLGDADAVQAVHRELDRLEAGVTRITAAFDASDAWQDSGAITPVQWLMGTCRMKRATAWRRIRLGRALRHMAGTERAWLTGEISGDHVERLASVRTNKVADVFARDEDMLVGWARTYRYFSFCRALAYWSHAADPDGADQDAKAKENAREFHCSQSFDDTWFLDGRLDPIRGAIFSKELIRLCDELFAQDWKEAKARLGRDPVASELSRTPAQRRADALVEMAIRSRTAPKDGRRPEPLFAVLVGYETFAGRICELADRTVVAPGALVNWLDQAWIERIVFESPSRVMDVGAQRRIFTGATRRAIEVRDQECFHPMCDTPAERCQIDHVQPYECGGPTVQDNGRCACAKHNRWRHKRRRE